MKWQILNQSVKNKKQIKEILLENRNLKSKEEKEDFLNPKDPNLIPLKEFGINVKKLKKIIERLKIAKRKKEKVIIFGDYDCDGICATAILWETLYKLGFDCLPYIPDRFSEGYGFKLKSFENPKFKALNPKLIITVDNGIIAYEAISKAKKKGIDVIVCDHHTKGSISLSSDYILHSTAVCGSTLAWILAKEISSKKIDLDLVALATVTDQMPLIGINRSFVKWGLKDLEKTKRIGLKTLITESKIVKIGVYEIGYILAPRINAMGRLADALDALRLLCTKDTKKAYNLAKVLGKTNIKRQEIVEEVLVKALKQVKTDSNEIIVISGDYHEGVIGLASGKITEKYYRPSIVVSTGKEISKASARSIYGFNIIEAIKKTELILDGGGHPMAAGFSIKTEKIKEFTEKITKIAQSFLTDEILSKKLKIDMILNFDQINRELIEIINELEPIGYGNPSAVFMTKKIKILKSKTVGSGDKHLKLILEQNKIKQSAIWFNFSDTHIPTINTLYDIAYTVEENNWNNNNEIQLKIKDIKF